MKLYGCYGFNVFLKIFNIQTISALPEGRRLSFSALCFAALNVFCTVCEETLTPLWVFKLYFVGVGDLKGICCDFVLLLCTELKFWKYLLMLNLNSSSIFCILQCHAAALY